MLAGNHNLSSGKATSQQKKRVENSVERLYQVPGIICDHIGSVRKPQTPFVFIDTNTNFVFVFVSIFGSETTDTQTNTIDQ
jgi:hypothetical protein